MSDLNLENIKKFCDWLREAEEQGIRQISGSYRRYDPETDAECYCALGICANKLKPDFLNSTILEEILQFFAAENAPTLDISRLFCNRVVHLNDTYYKSFKEIADILEEQYLSSK